MRAGLAMVVAALAVIACLQWGSPSAAGSRTPDSNDTPETATPVSPGVPISDSVNITDDQYDFYRLDGVLAGQAVRAAVGWSSPSASLNLSIRDTAGNNLTAVSQGGQLRGDTALAPQNGTYFIEVKAHSGASDYMLDVTVEFPPILSPGSRVWGNLSADAANRTDFYRFWLSGNTGGRRELAQISIAQNGSGALLGAALVDLLLNRTSMPYNESWNLSEKANMSAAASYTGWYFCRLNASTGAAGYMLDYSRAQALSDGDNSPADARAAPLDSYFDGHVSKAWDHFDWYSYLVGANDNLHIQVRRGNSTDGCAVRVLYSNMSQVQLSENWNGSSTVNNITIDLVPVLSDMTYYIGVEATAAYRAVPINQWTDDEASLDYNISFTSPDHPPQIIAPFDNLTVKEDQKGHLIMAAHFRDIDGDPLNFSLTGAANITGAFICASGELELTPSANWNGRQTGYIWADDGRGARTMAVINITVEAVEDPPYVKRPIADIPMAQGGTDASLDLSAVFSDNDTQYGDMLRYSVEDNGSINVTINASGKVRLAGDPDFFGKAAMRFLATDNVSNSVSTPCNVIVEHVNRPPAVRRPPPGVRLLEDQGVTVDLAGVFVDPDGDPFTLAVSGNLQVQVAISGTNVTFQPRPDAAGFTDHITFTATDDSGAESEPIVINVTVVPVNDRPAITMSSPAGDIFMPENQSRQFEISATDVESGSAINITWFLDGHPVLMGVATYVLRTNYSSAGLHNVTVEVSDGELSTFWTWNVTVDGQNREPEQVKIISPRQGDVYKEGATVVFEGSASDPDGDPLNLTWYEGGNVLGRGARLSLQPAAGSHSIVLEASDGGISVRTRALSFLVKRNSPPSMLSLEPATGRTFQQGEKVRFSAEFTDADGEALSYCWTESGRPLSGLQAFNRSDLSPGRHVIRLSVSDGTETVSTNVTIEVAPSGVLPGGGMLAWAAAVGAVVAAVAIIVIIRRRRPPGPAPVRAPPA